MDEPFSALDVLTAENLRGELVKLWEGHGAPIKSILIVTHNITADGKEFAAADILTSKQLFARQAAKHAPLVRTITQALAATADHTLRTGFFLDLLRRGFSPSEARGQLDTAVDWGRYAELYDYDSDDAELTLEPGAQEYL